MKWLDKIFKKNDNLENIENDTVKSFTNDNIEYHLNLSELSCTCKDWALERFIYNKDDPRRLCKHLIKKIDLKTLNEDLKYFREKIEHHKEYNNGFAKYVDEIRYIKEADCKVLYRNDSEWNSVCDSFGITYGLSITSYGYRWTNRGKPNAYEKVERYFQDIHSILLQRFNDMPIGILEKEEESLSNFIRKNLPRRGKCFFTLTPSQGYDPEYKEIHYDIDEFIIPIKEQKSLWDEFYKQYGRNQDEKFRNNPEKYYEHLKIFSNELFERSHFYSTYDEEISIITVQNDKIIIEQNNKNKFIYIRNSEKINSEKIKYKNELEKANKLEKEIKEQNKIYSSTYKIYDLLSKYKIKHIIGKDILKIINTKYVKDNLIINELEKYCVNLYDSIRFYDEYFLEFIIFIKYDIELVIIAKKEVQTKRKEKKNEFSLEKIPKTLKYSKRYLDTKEILEICKAPFGIAKFNSILKQFNLITKIEYRYNIFSNYILINNGLKYGDNIAEKNKFNYCKENLNSFRWLEFNSETNQYIQRNNFIVYNEKLCIPSCYIKWKIDDFLELYKMVCNIYINELNQKKNNINSFKIKINTAKKSYVENAECPHCKSKHTHKKDIRLRKDFRVQRYQCRDCNKIFQEKIDDE